ncbi:mannitol-1-phosphate 5-dehydrogenase [Listeria fleischmannii 1991]|uniref:Mannitol-1-phosphate 5-dehydrogenase n=2 Tax=Listeria fleischmannii TaxID=1069827 RepID=A0A2X3GYR5_9LIST|nr:mannitol-1-phosphate 5-dehydrogenase [Listeria fleischmannii]EMG27764.1 mannitol-1-phosphate 5-dehydrogenase [Listeria fleischmannii subsp. fleischmannii LU2006-1]KMT59557.1 mannitol-1-phosphate 5-dehydrogenase [Listeria fleischmannii 1991]SQC67476.1 Mannitol-1-phosphate 5-dehydrogenase [Listeria fleischmannii subsp. fleischmannii]
MNQVAVHFGAGNIGRGFIGLLLSQAGYHVIFSDVNENITNELHARKSYKVVLAANEKEEIMVTNVDAINSLTEPEKLTDAIRQAKIVTTAVGPNILPKIAKSISLGLENRPNEPLLIIACENMIGGSELLKEEVYKYLSPEGKKHADLYVRFPNAAVDRIVPNQTNIDPLEVLVEPFFEWVVEKPAHFALPEIEGLHFVDDLTPYIERKLFTVNTGHAVTAYLGYMREIDSILSAIHNERILFAVRSALEETGALLEKKFNFSHEEHQLYIDKIIDRFKNPNISDYVDRVGRSPIRKIGENDRFVQPARQFVEAFNETPKALAKAIAAALHFKNPTDEEACLLQKSIEEEGLEQTISNYTGLKPYSMLFERVKESYYEQV